MLRGTTGGEGTIYSLVMNKGERDRAGEEAVCSAIVLNALAEAFGIEDRSSYNCFPVKMSNASYIEAVISGKQPLAVYRVNHGWSDTPPNDAIMLAGSFRPLHRAHRALLETGLSVAGKALTPCFEISVRNVEKPEIATSDLDERVQQFQEPGDIVIVTCAATFLEKARLMPGTTFVIGYDTAVRLVR